MNNYFHDRAADYLKNANGVDWYGAPGTAIFAALNLLASIACSLLAANEKKEG